MCSGPKTIGTQRATLIPVPVAHSLSATQAPHSGMLFFLVLVHSFVFGSQEYSKPSLMHAVSLLTLHLTQVPALQAVLPAM